MEGWNVRVTWLECFRPRALNRNPEYKSFSIFQFPTPHPPFAQIPYTLQTVMSTLSVPSQPGVKAGGSRTRGHSAMVSLSDRHWRPRERLISTLDMSRTSKALLLV